MSDFFITILAAVIVAFLAIAAFNAALAVTRPDWPQYQGETR